MITNFGANGAVCVPLRVSCLRAVLRLAQESPSSITGAEEFALNGLLAGRMS